MHSRCRKKPEIEVTVSGTNVLSGKPERILDIPSRTQFEQALSGFNGAVLAVVHDRYFIERFADEVWWVEAGGIRREYVR